MTDTWDNEGGAEAREEQLYHESARELARQVVDLETTVEGLGQENTELLGLLKGRNERVSELTAEIEQHKTRYRGAISMIERRQEQLDLQRKAYQKLAVQFAERGDQYVELVQKIAELNVSVRALRDVPVNELDHAIGVLANAIDTALLT